MTDGESAKLRGFQIRCSSPYGHLSEFLEEVFTSFAKFAPASRQLIVKIHPLDNGLERWFSKIPKLAQGAGIQERVHIVRGGDLGAFLHYSKGVVLVNSTVGLHALRFRCQRSKPSGNIRCILEGSGTCRYGAVSRFRTRAHDDPDEGFLLQHRGPKSRSAKNL